ncbi:GntR family transcriptional regulator [Vagococcus zengguangii]|uniref:GntR family transcriptional regulator n=1 Tax=Vagococcus zengguangii TaxID=2571750 RepID=A0A4D7CUW9_9ENTE|nr:GntR family transcriptional regulator [Vagococcus zengguangii]QCI86111.1 GntR family transcriptional regulator [Vagococcus zengguangii]TLG78356.1 GntR family transcriptional regulator [Vagococcus zengguangii]
MKGKKVLYLEVAMQLKHDILKEKYPLNTLIPSETELEAQFKVSKITIRKAVEILVQEGYLEKKSGKGTTVISNRPFNKLSKALSFSTVLENKGLTLQKKLIAIEEINGKELGIGLAGKVVKLTRMYYLEGEPYILFEHYLPNMTQSIESLSSDSSLYSWLAYQGKDISYIKDEFDVAEVTPEMNRYLEISKPFALKRQRYSYNVQNELIEYSIAYYDIAREPYSIEYEV